MRVPYAFAVELRLPLPAAIDTLRSALAAEQMGVVSDVDVQATLKAGLGLDSPPNRLLGICSPTIAQALIDAEPDITALLPCGCGVSESGPGRTRIVLQDPRVIGALATQPGVRPACERAHAALRRVVGRLEAVATAASSAG